MSGCCPLDTIGGAPGGGIAEVVSAFDATGGQLFSGTITVALDTIQAITDPAVYVLALGAITVIPPGFYEIVYEASFASNFRQGIVDIFLENNGVRVPGTTARDSFADGFAASNPQNAGLSGTVLLQLAPADSIRVRASVVSGVGVAVTVPDCARLTITRVR